MCPATDEPIRIDRYAAGGWESQGTYVIEEAIVVLTVNGETWLNFTCTPTYIEELCVGFLFNEGIVQSVDEIKAMTLCANGFNLDVWLNRTVEKPTQWQRNSGCTGGITFHHNSEINWHVLSEVKVSSTMITDGMSQMLEAQTMYRQTKGLHCSAIFDGQCLQYIAEDIGRHNTLDKLGGMTLLHPKVFQPVMVFTTGRVSSDMLQKSARLGAIVVVSRTSPTTRSIELAVQSGITLVGYTRKDQFSVYSHPDRISDFNQHPSQKIHPDFGSQSSNSSA